MSGIGTFIKTWLYKDKDNNNILRYESLSMNASNLYYQSLKNIKKELEKKKFSKPVFITISEDDSVITAKKIVSIFTKNFTHPKSRLLWFGKKSISMDKRVASLTSYLPKKNIENFSHLSVLFKKDHHIYGEKGSYKMYNNGQDKIYDKGKDELWYSAWGLKKENIYFARLTWNPYVKETMTLMFKVINSN